MDNFLVLGIVVAVIAVAFIAWRVIGNRRPVPEALRVGRTLPDFVAPVPERALEIPVVLIIGTSMSAGTSVA